MEHTQCCHLTGISARELGKGNVDVVAMEEQSGILISLHMKHTQRGYLKGISSDVLYREPFIATWEKATWMSSQRGSR